MKLIDILSDLRSKGFRVTKAREALIDFFIGDMSPHTVLDVTQALEKRGLSVNKTTIYRELAFLQEQGIITEVRFDSERAYYEFALRDHHHHVKCVECKDVFDIDVKLDLHAEEKRISKKYSINIMEHSLEFFGVCVSCE